MNSSIFATLCQELMFPRVWYWVALLHWPSRDLFIFSKENAGLFKPRDEFAPLVAQSQYQKKYDCA
jgi:hypothetical protein